MTQRLLTQTPLPSPTLSPHRNSQTEINLPHEAPHHLVSENKTLARFVPLDAAQASNGSQGLDVDKDLDTHI